jgi:hypothetical protein
MQHLVGKRRGNEMEQTIQLQPGRTVMKHLMISLLLAGGLIALSTMDASALVCARGVYRAGCVGAGGPRSSRGVLSVPLLLHHDGPLLFAAGCTDNPAKHPLKTCHVSSD